MHFHGTNSATIVRTESVSEESNVCEAKEKDIPFQSTPKTPSVPASIIDRNILDKPEQSNDRNLSQQSLTPPNPDSLPAESPIGPANSTRTGSDKGLLFAILALVVVIVALLTRKWLRTP